MTMRRSKYPSLYQVNTRVWLAEQAAWLGRRATLDDFSEAFLNQIVRRGFDWFWPLGVWQTGPAARAISRENLLDLDEYARTLPNFTIDDVSGSPFAVQKYSVHEDFGGPEALARLRQRLRTRGVRLMCDFVPNHTAPDHPWASEHPEYYIAGTEDDLRAQPQNYMRVKTKQGPKILARGKDPYFDAWRDVLQLNYRCAALRTAMIAELQRIANQCDGVRCDMAMLVLPDVIEQTWGDKSLPSDGTPPVDVSFWLEATTQVHDVNKQFLFMAEVYWDREWELQHHGFHYCYDKRFYDRLESQHTPEIRAHLTARLDYQDRLARFLENHDEPRAASVFPREAHPAAAIACYLTPGLRFFHEGQFEGRAVRVSMHLGRRPPEPVDGALRDFYEHLLTVLQSLAVRDGDWRLLDVLPTSAENATHANFLAYSWEGPMGERLLVVVNYGAVPGQCLVRWPWSGDVGQTVSLQDRFRDVRYERDGDELNRHGMYFDEPGWAYYVFDVEAE